MSRSEEWGRRADLFYITTLAEATPAAILAEPIWRVAGKKGTYRLLEEEGP